MQTSSYIMARDSWSVLPTDNLSLVLNLVSFYDLVRLTAVCKNWLQPVLDDLRRRHRNLPWIISIDNGKLRKLGLIDPWLNQSYSLLKTIRRDGLEELLLGTRVDASKFGWLLMSKQKVMESGGSSTLLSFLLYNPFRNEIIELPPLDLNRNRHDSKAMFSTTPTSPDCVICVVSRVTREGTAICMLSTYKDENWTSVTVTDGCPGWAEGRWEFQDAVHMDGKFYCIFKHYLVGSFLRLGIFNVALQQWSRKRHPFWSEEYRSMMELDGKLLLVTDTCRTLKIRKLDRSEQNWKRTKSLGDGVLFVEHLPFSSSSMAAVGEAKEFVNMIVHLGPSGCNTYTCKNDQGHWKHHQTRECHPFSQYTFWIDSPNFQY